NKIIDDMLDFARARGVELKKTAFDAWLDGVLNELGAPSGVTVRRMLGAPKACPAIDDERIRRAIVNIYDNAYQAMIEEPVGRYPARKKKLTVSTKVTKGRLELAITDNGPGMPPEVFAAAFEPLYSTKGFGVGLGLPIVKQIMEQHDGGIEITCEHGSGTRVVLWLPLGQSTTKTKNGVK
ncbi:MAG: HAMP domain-containing sensor histidine kinase, partial [Alphaproteobacteria bacterium]|nr:HAMP domain-containing sensor histidine kinase [Alphaproteobacteria bacterium]